MAPDCAASRVSATVIIALGAFPGSVFACVLFLRLQLEVVSGISIPCLNRVFVSLWVSIMHWLCSTGATVNGSASDQLVQQTYRNSSWDRQWTPKHQVCFKHAVMTGAFAYAVS